jgi:hypothetical protein
LEAFIESLTPNDIRSMRETVCVGYLAVFATLTVLRFMVHMMSQPVPWRGIFLTPNFPMVATWKGFSSTPSFRVAAVGAVIAAVIYLLLPSPDPILTTDPVLDADSFLGFTKTDYLRIFEIVVLSIAAIIIIVFGTRPVLNLTFAQLSASQSSSPKKPSISSPYLDIIAVVVAAVGGAAFLHKMYPRLSEHPINPAIADQAGEALFIGLTRLQVLGLAEQVILFVVALLVFRLVIRRLWIKILTSGVAFSNFAKKTVFLIGWTTGIIFSLLLLWRMIQIISL